MNPALGTCDRCHQPVLWTVTLPLNNRKPVDPQPDPTGNTCVWTDVAGRLCSRQLTHDRPTPEAAERLHMPHAATCPAPRPRQTTLRIPRRPYRQGTRR
jgi:hypothetical protein